MDLFLIGLVAFAAAVLTFFSGFGLGTLLLPVFLLFFPAGPAIALTALVHLLNNLFKAGLMGKHASRRVVLGFGLTALPGAWLGARLLGWLEGQPPLGYWQWGAWQGEWHLLHLAVALLMAAFASLELLPEKRQPAFPTRLLPVGGLLSGFFGGLSGHQGALRSAFLLRLGLSKETFIASGILVACAIDLVRLGVYFHQGLAVEGSQQWQALITGVTAAMAGALLGQRLLKKMTLRHLHLLVAIGIFLLAILLGLGLLR